MKVCENLMSQPAVKYLIKTVSAKPGFFNNIDKIWDSVDLQILRSTELQYFCQKFKHFAPYTNWN